MHLQKYITSLEKFTQKTLIYSRLQVSKQVTRDIEERINKCDLIKMKNFCLAEKNSIKMKREPTVWESIFANDSLDKGLISKICKELI